MLEEPCTTLTPHSFDELVADFADPCELREASPVLERAWKSIFDDKMLRRVHRWLAKLGVPKADLPDVAQVVFEQAVKSFSRYDPTRARPERWLNRIAVHTASRFIAKAYHWREVLVDPAEMDAAGDDAPGVLAGILSEQRRELLLVVITRLVPEHAQILLACDLRGCSIEEFAAMRGMPVSTTYKHRTRALAAARVIAREVQEAESRKDQSARPATIHNGLSRRPGNVM